MNKLESLKIEIVLKFNGILFSEDVKPEIEEWLKKLKFRHLKEVIMTKYIEGD